MKPAIPWRPTWTHNNPLKGLHEDILWIAPLFIMAMLAYASAATVNHGTDGNHSQKSAHYLGQAVDINHKDMRFPWVKEQLSWQWFYAVSQFGENLIELANKLAHLVGLSTTYYLVLEKSHFHLEIALAGAAPNIKGWEKGKYFYVHPEVRAILEQAHG